MSAFTRRPLFLDGLCVLVGASCRMHATFCQDVAMFQGAKAEICTSVNTAWLCSICPFLQVNMEPQVRFSWLIRPFWHRIRHSWHKCVWKHVVLFSDTQPTEVLYQCKSSYSKWRWYERETVLAFQGGNLKFGTFLLRRKYRNSSVVFSYSTKLQSYWVPDLQ